MAGFLVSVTVALLCLCVGVHSHPLPDAPNDFSWDYLLFVQRYLPGLCHSQKNCEYPANATSWNIHGLWPSDENSEGPEYCNKSAVFDAGVLQNMRSTLVAMWTNCLPNKGFESFWSHEYLKHGTCAEVIPELSTEWQFFHTVIQLFEQQFNFGPVLDRAGITPSTTTPYSFDMVNNAILKYFGVKPFLQCSYDKVNHRQVLMQAYLCLSKDFSLRECSDYVFSEHGGCWSTEDIYYIPSQYAQGQ